MQCNCRVCGYELNEPPWGNDGMSPSFEICPCCGVEFGYEDVSLQSIRTFRSKWLASGSPWFDISKRPKAWDISVQLELVPFEWR